MRQTAVFPLSAVCVFARNSSAVPTSFPLEFTPSLSALSPRSTVDESWRADLVNAISFAPSPSSECGGSPVALIRSQIPDGDGIKERRQGCEVGWSEVCVFLNYFSFSPHPPSPRSSHLLCLQFKYILEEKIKKNKQTKNNMFFFSKIVKIHFQFLDLS